MSSLFIGAAIGPFVGSLVLKVTNMKAKQKKKADVLSLF